MSHIIQVASQHSVEETANRINQLLEAKGLKVFARVNHAAGAQSIGETLRPTELFIFGNPAIGTPLMKLDQNVALDLPQKVLIREDEAGKVWLSYDDPARLQERHQLAGGEEVINKISGALSGLTAAAGAAE